MSRIYDAGRLYSEFHKRVQRLRLPKLSQSKNADQESENDQVNVKRLLQETMNTLNLKDNVGFYDVIHRRKIEPLKNFAH